MFHNILKEKTPFWNVKTKRPNSRKTGIFSKGLVHGLGQNLAMLTSFNLILI